MATAAETAHKLFDQDVGTAEGVGDWYQVTQDQIDAFADVTHDHQFIHVDPERAAQLSPWKVTIAHGFLTLSLLTHLVASVPQDAARMAGVVMGVNYGFDRVRFINAVPVDSRIRASTVLKAVDLRDPNTLHVTRTVTVEIEGQDKPALVADWVTRLVYG